MLGTDNLSVTTVTDNPNASISELCSVLSGTRCMNSSKALCAMTRTASDVTFTHMADSEC